MEEESGPTLRLPPCKKKAAAQYHMKMDTVQKISQLAISDKVQDRPGSGKATEIEYTEVVIIGNGPSGICLSFMLNGNWPYFSGETHPNKYLQRRLEDGKGKSLIEQDLEYLSSGLEGRSPNEVALLFDTLCHPDADMGMDLPSVLKWKHHEEHVIPHVTLGKTQAGGAWQMMDGAMQTLSLGNWMELPDFPLKSWAKEHHRTLGSTSNGNNLRRDRATVDDIRQYYMQYVQVKNLESNFRVNTTVTSVQKVLDICHAVDCESGEQTPCSKNHCDRIKWEVRGCHSKVDADGHTTCEEFCYRAPNIVLASGAYDMPNRLYVPGEHNSYILHSLRELEKVVENKQLKADSNPLVVIGAGLSAADAILCARFHGIPVVHVFRRDIGDPLLVFKQLPPALYPEYRQVYQMMKDDCPDSFEGYTRYSRHRVVEFLDEGKVLIRSQESVDRIIQASYAVVQIGSRPDLSYMPNEAKNLGVVPGMPIDMKHNPIDVDAYSYQSVHEPGLFAMGPLVGDNFVRFLRGGALAIASHLWKKQNNQM